jgi:chromosome segregation ATPase
MNDDHYEGALLEEIRDQNKAILEGLQPLPKIAKDIGKLQEDVETLKNDMQAVKAIAKDHSHQLDGHEDRLTQLEAA